MDGGEGYRRVRTERLDLRAVGPGDTAGIQRITGDPAVAAFLPGGPGRSMDGSRAWFERRCVRWNEDGIGYWTIWLRTAASLIGVGGVERRRDFWNLYYHLDAAHRGRGYATELARAAARAAATLDHELPLAAWIHESNTASQAVAQRLGLADYGLLEPHHWNGEPMHYWADRAPRLLVARRT